MVSRFLCCCCCYCCCCLLSLLFVSCLTVRWDGELGSLSATLYRARPDVFPVSTANPIPNEIPPSSTDLYDCLLIKIVQLTIRTK
jgi:hypothetical protein